MKSRTITTRRLNLDDIQGNVTRAYGRYSFPFARYFFLNFGNPAKGRAFLDKLRGHVTTAARWNPETKPDVTLNVALSFMGLLNLGLSTRTLKAMPDEFIDGMKNRAFVLGDSDPTKTGREERDWNRKWDEIWKLNRTGGANDVHMWLSMNAQSVPGKAEPLPALEEQTNWLRDLCAAFDVTIMPHDGPGGQVEYQAANAVFTTLPNGAQVPTAKEHFGFTDGLGDPTFEGQYPDAEMPAKVIGRGKWMDAEDGWQALATGEFIIGHPDESQQLPQTSRPPEFTRNGSFLVYRKLHENVTSFREVIDAEAARYSKVMDVPVDEAAVTLKAKIVGRWPDGVPLSRVPGYDDWRAFRDQRGFDDPDPEKAGKAYISYLRSPEPMDFRYADDISGAKCPVGTHLRRVNTRDYLDPLNAPTGDNPKATTQLNKRRRILRRGLPYGPALEGTEMTDDTEQGVIFMVVNASIFRQFEFVQQQWIQYGLDFNSGNNTCPLLGNHDRYKRHVIEADPDGDKPPYVMNSLKTFVETRGGDYFFIPSLTALRMLAMGIVDPT